MSVIVWQHAQRHMTTSSLRRDADGGGLSPASDPLQRLEAELGEADGGQSGDERLYEEAQGLVEEAWSVLTECLSIREGLLDACREIERTMGGMQRRLGSALERPE